MEYQIFSAVSPIALIQIINEALAAGWRPTGGVASVTTTIDPAGTPDPNGTLTVYFYQAMVKEQSFAAVDQ